MSDSIVQIAGGIVLVDLTDDLPRHKTKRYRKRDVAKIDRIYVHHSGRLGRPGKPGALASAGYAIKEPTEKTPKKVAYAGGNYHVWVPWAGGIRAYQRPRDTVCYRMNADETRCAHTYGLNPRGWSIVLQGNTTTDGMSDSQKEVLEALLPWGRERFELEGDWLGWHSIADKWGGRAKKACPGREAVEWLEAYRDGL